MGVKRRNIGVNLNDITDRDIIEFVDALNEMKFTDSEILREALKVYMAYYKSKLRSKPRR